MTRKRKTYCGKQRHATKADALKAAVTAKISLQKRKSRRGLKGEKSYRGTGAKISVYRCQVCGFYHWGHRVKGSKHVHLKKRK